MQYFSSMETVFYQFGNETSATLFQDISRYIDIIDELKDNVISYSLYDINEGYRPDQLSQALYGSPLYYWTFYLMNDHVRERGWPLSNEELMNVVNTEFPGVTLTTRDSLSGKFKIGQTVRGASSGATGKIVHRNLNLGQVVLNDVTGTFSLGGEGVQSNVTSLTETTTESIVAVSSSLEKLAARHYIDGNKKITDIDPAIGPGALLTEITNQQFFHDENEKLKEIKIIKPNLIERVSSDYKKALRS